MNSQPARFEPTPAQTERMYAMVDILYLVQLVALYMVSAVYPFFGLLYGILLVAGSLSKKAKKVGRICLILGIINLGLCIIVAAGVIILSLTGIFAGIAAAD